ncbi:rRNA pseudouridine synthase [Candidatus Woesearchaeota archaeon]|nr:rRNA pseudouridine synthase [Candidatus Woesearchaeota archaeon]
MLQRVQKILAQAGVASRRKAEELIAQGRVTVNGTNVKIGQSADAEKDRILVDGKPVRSERFVYILLNKPLNVVTSVSDPLGRKTVRDLVPVQERVFPVGRLDRNATGLVLLTNDGALANRMMHPRYETAKTYVATLSSPVTPSLLERLQKGIVVEDRKVLAKDVEQLGPNMVRLSIHEGRKHIVKKLFVGLGTHVDALQRVALGPLSLGTLQPGAWRALTDAEVRQLRQALAL